MIRPGIKKLFRLAFHRREDAARDAGDEMRLHIELRAAQLVREGLSPGAARAEAERRFGAAGETRQAMEASAAHREGVMRKREWAESFVQDLHYVLRSLRRSPTFVISVVLTLALGLGANAALFSILDRFYLQAPAGVQSPEQVRWIIIGRMTSRNERQVMPVLSAAAWIATADALPRGNAILGYQPGVKVHLGKDDSAREGIVTPILGDYFAVLGVRLVVGRNFSPEEIKPDGFAPVAIVTSVLARERFGSEQGALGQPFDVGPHRFTIIGVAPPGFRGTALDAADAWVPMNTRGSWIHRNTEWFRDTHALYIYTLVRTTDVASIPALVTAASSALKETWIVRSDTIVATLGPLRESLLPGFYDKESTIAARLAGVAFVILLIACANVANLQLARGLQRRREIGVRLALGVSRARLCTLLLTESVVLALIGGLAALLVAVWVATALRHALLPDIQWSAAAVGWQDVSFALVTALIAGVIVGLVPALHASRPNLADILKGGGREGTSERSVLRMGLLVTQIALSCVLLTGAVLFVRSLNQVEAIDIGFDKERLIVARAYTALDSGRKPEEIGALLTEAASRIEKLPGVERVSLTQNDLMQFYSSPYAFLPNGDSLPKLNGERPATALVSPGYFAATGMHVLQGREFALEDRAGSELVVIVNALFAKTVWPGQSPLGKCFIIDKPVNPCRRVVGVVSNSHHSRVIEAPSMQFFTPIAQDTSTYPGSMEIRTTPDRAAAVAASVQQLLLGMAGSGMQPRTQLFAEQLAPDLRSWKLGAALFTAAGLLALLVAAVGIYGTIAYTFGQRTQEIGVRIALGAHSSNIIGLVLRSSVAISAVGVAAGLGIALWAGRFAKPLLYETSPSDPYVLGGVAVALIAVAIVASLVPAMRAKRVDPMEALRAEC